jgi:beta-glucosidase
MPDTDEADILRRELHEVNDRLARTAERLVAYLDSAEGLRNRALIWGAIRSERSSSARLRAGARAFVALLDLHPAGDGEPLSRVGVPIFPEQEGYSTDVALSAGRLMALGSLYLGMENVDEGLQIARLWDVLVGGDVVNTVLRDALAGKRLNPRPRVPPHIFDYIRDFAQRNCVAGVTSAALDVTQVVRGRSVTSDARGITAIEPPRGCGGQLITLRGAGFGQPQPQGVDVYFPTRDGRCVRAEVVQAGWSDTAITVVAPQDVGSGCVGFVRDGSTGAGQLATVVSSFVGEVTSCLGPLFAEGVRAVWTNVTDSALRVPCPPCSAGTANRFTGGPPVIESFLARRVRDADDHVGTTADLVPGDTLELRWRVDNADTVHISPIPVNGQLHELPPLAGLLPTVGNRLVRWEQNDPLAFATFSWDAAYELRAANGCATVAATVLVHMRHHRKNRPDPDDFLWGVATAGRQVEGGIATDDWEIFTNDPQIKQRLYNFKTLVNLKIQPQPAKRALNHWAFGDFVHSVERAHALGLNAYRLSVEWSRVEPAPGHYDATALGNYQMMVAAVRAFGMEPIVVLNHMSLPAWALTPPRETAYTFFAIPGGKDTDPAFQASLRGWETTATVEAFVAYVKYVVTNLQDVNWWITLNEPLGTTVLAGYLGSIFPPGFFGDENRALAAIHHLIEAHARAYETIHRLSPSARVGITDQWLQCKDDLSPDAARQFEYYNQDLLINALVHGQEDRAISVDAPNYERVLGIPASEWRAHVDFFGLQYYKSVYPYRFCCVPRWLGGRVDLDLADADFHHLLLNDMGWEMSPVGLYDCLMKLRQITHRNGEDLPILVAENGTAEVTDHNRAAYITAHLRQLERARQDGAPVIGYLHWSISDNWEWIDGYRPEARFGLFSVQLPADNPVHSITDGALAYARAVAAPPLSIDTAAKAFGSYRADGAGIEHPSLSPDTTWSGTLDGQPITLVLGSLGPAPSSPPARRRDLIGWLFHADKGRWVRLDEVVWESATRTIQFFHHGQSAGGDPTPERVFVGILDGNGATFTGVATRPGAQPGAHAWQVSREPFVGAWQGHVTPNALITLSLSRPENRWLGRVLLATDWLPLESIHVHPWGFTASHGGNNVTGVFSLGSMTVSPWAASLTRLPDGLPF